MISIQLNNGSLNESASPEGLIVADDIQLPAASPGMEKSMGCVRPVAGYFRRSTPARSTAECGESLVQNKANSRLSCARESVGRAAECHGSPLGTQETPDGITASGALSCQTKPIREWPNSR